MSRFTRFSPRITFVSLIASLFLFLPPASAQPPSQNMELLAETLHAPSFARLAVEGDRLYAATGYGLEVFDISDVQQPQSLGRVVTYGTSSHIEVRDSVVYLMDSDRGSYVFDASEPENITLLTQRLLDTYFSGQRIAGNRLYECVWEEGIRISDISDPRNPIFRGTYRRVRLPTSIWVQDTVTYIADILNETVVMANISNPARPTFYGDIQVPRTVVEDICVTDTLLILAAGQVGTMIYGISNPISPNLLATIVTNDYSLSVTVVENALYLADNGGFLRVFDIADPTNPVESFTGTRYVGYVTTCEQGLFASATSWLLYNVDDPLHPQEIAVSASMNYVLHLASFQNTVYLSNIYPGIRIVDISDPRDPRTVDFIDTLNCWRVATTEDGWLYTTGYQLEDSSNHLRAWDLTDPHHPQMRGEAGITTSSGEFTIDGDLLGYCNYEGAVELWDISSRGAPSLYSQIGEYPGIDLRLEGNNLYVITADSWLRMFDVSDPERPAYTGGIEGLEYPYGVTSIGNKVYVAEGPNGVAVFDVSDAGNIVRVGQTGSDDWGVDITYSDSLLYLSDFASGIRVYNPFAAAIPRYYGYLDTPGRVNTSVVSNGICAIADWYDLTIARYVHPDEIVEQVGPPRTVGLLSSFPKPANSSFKTLVSIPTAGSGSVRLYSLDGKLAMEQIFETKGGKRLLVFDVSALPSGSYNLTLDAVAAQGGKRYSQREQITVVK